MTQQNSRSPCSPHTAARAGLLAGARQMHASGLAPGRAGNLSLRLVGEGEGEGEDADFLITPSGISYADLRPEDLVPLHFDGTPAAGASKKPSSEWRMHRDVYRARPEVGAVLHAHAPFATSLACLRADIPPFHYMIARFGGASVRTAAYALFGSQELSDAALAALDQRRACLLANHGMLVLGDSVSHALELAEELETLCEQYYRACQLGRPALLTPEEMRQVAEKFVDYGKQDD